jgi:hypothetical protein
MRTLALVVGSVLAVGIVGAAAVLIVDTIRTGDDRPEPCAGVLERGASGELLDDTAVVDRAWAAVSDRNGDQDVIGDLGGSLLVTRRTCVLYAGVLMGSESLPQQPGPTVVFAESNVAGYQNLARFAEVRLPESDPSAGAPLVAVAGHSVLLGNELNAGLVLPLSGAYLAPEIDSSIGTEDVAITALALTSADGVAAETRAERIGAGVFRIGAAPDRTLAPNDQVADRDTVLLLDGPEHHDDEIVVVPALPEATWPTGARVALQVNLDPGVPLDIATARRVAALLPGLSADPRMRALLDSARRYPSLHITFSPDGRQATVRPPDPDAQSWATIQLPVRD